MRNNRVFFLALGGVLRFLAHGLGGGAPIFGTRVRGGAPTFDTGKTGFMTHPLHIIVEHSLRGGGDLFSERFRGMLFFYGEKM